MRKQGWYWILYDGKWRISLWSESMEAWMFSGTDFFCYDYDVSEIDETPITRPNA